jgi:hypothetical protein
MSEESKTDMFGTILHNPLRYAIENSQDVILDHEYAVEGTVDEVAVEVESEIEVAGVSESHVWTACIRDVEYEDEVEIEMPVDRVVQSCVHSAGIGLVLANLLHLDRATMVKFCHFVVEQDQVQAALDSDSEAEVGTVPDTAPNTPPRSRVHRILSEILANEDERLVLIGLIAESGYIIGTKVV